ncbi:P-II family nitrogen regulator [Thermopirellula anaerolimosa]
MRQIVAIVRPFVAERVLESLRNAPVEAITVCEVKGFGRQKHYLEEYRGGVYAFAFLPKVEITLWVDDLRAEEVMRMVVQQARSGRMGDGKVFVVASEAVVVDLAAPECGGTDAADPKHPHAKEDDG